MATVQVQLLSTSFAKAANYFIALQLGKGDKTRSEVSPTTAKPLFSKNTFTFAIPGGVTEDAAETLQFGAFVVLQAKGSSKKGNARVLGSCSLQIKDLAVRLLRGDTVKETLTFVRRPQPNKEVPVGRTTVAVHLVGVGDGVVSGESGKPDTATCVIVARHARALSAAATQSAPSTLLEARLISPAAADALAEFSEAAATAAKLKGSGRNVQAQKEQARKDIEEKKRAAANLRPAASASTRPITQTADPFWNEVLVLEVPKEKAVEGYKVRIDIVDCGAEDWTSIGGASFPFAEMTPNYQYNVDLRVDANNADAALYCSVSTQDSMNGEMAIVRSNNAHERLEVMLNRFTSPLPFRCQLVAAVELVRHECVDAHIDRLIAGRRGENGPLWNQFTRCRYGGSSGPDTACIGMARSDYKLMRPLRHLTPASTKNTELPKWDFPMRFDITGQSPSDSDFPSTSTRDPGGPCWLVAAFYESSDRGPGRSGTASDLFAPGELVGFAKQRLRDDMPDNGTAVAFDGIPVSLFTPRDGPGKGEPTEDAGAEVSVTFRLWSAAPYLRHLEGADGVASLSSAHTNWVKARANFVSDTPLERIAHRNSAQAGPGSIAGLIAKAATQAKERDYAGEVARADGTPTAGAAAILPTQAETTSNARLRGRNGGRGADGSDLMAATRAPPTAHPGMRGERASGPRTSSTGADTDYLGADSALLPTVDARPLLESSLVPPPRTRPGRNAAAASLRGGTPPPNFNAGPDEVRTLHERLAVLTEDIAHKQTLIDRLLKEVDKRSEAIRNCGVEIVELRRQNKKVDAERARLALRLADKEREMEAEAKSLMDTTDLDRFANGGGSAGAEELLRRIRVMSQKYKAEKARNEQIMARLKALHEQALDKRDTQLRFDRLQRAHTQQASFLQKLQEENQKIHVYRSTISTQERVIAKLEELMESKLRDRTGGHGGGAVQLKSEIQRLTRRNEDLERRIISGEGGARIREMQKQLDAAKSAARKSPGGAGGGGGASSDALRAKNERIKILEAQMVDNARGFAKELSVLKMKLMELDLGGF